VKSRKVMIKIYEVELKAKLKTGQKIDIEDRLKNTFNCIPQNCIYLDTYFDDINRSSLESEKELRLRKITKDNNETVFLTYKEPPFDNISKSKIEHEVLLSSYDEISIILEHLY
jgi:adenylate cyclase class 2